MMHIRAAFGIFKDMLLKGGVAIGGVAPPTGKAAVIASTSPQDTADVQEQLRKLRLQVQQRDNEINILVSMLRKREAAAGGVPSGPHSTLQPLPTERNTSTKHLGDPAAPQPESAMHTSTSTTLPATTHGSTSLEAAPAAAAAAAAEERLQRAQAGAQAGTSGRSGGRPGERSGVEPAVAGVLGGGSMTLLADRNKAFEMFRRSYRKNEVIEENKALLKAKYTEAKALGEQVNAGRERINGMKANIEKRRMERAMHEIAGGGPAAADALPPDPEEDRMKSIIEAEKVSYKDSFARLRELKREIEHLQMILEQSRVRLQRDFEEWLGVMARQQLHPPASPPPSHTRASAPPHSLHPPSLSKPLLPLNAPPRSDPPSSRQKPPPLPETARGAMRDSTNIFQSLTGSSQTVPSQSSATTNRGPPSGGPRIAWGTLDAPPPPLAPPIATSFGKGVVASGPVERPPSGSSNRGIMDDDGWVTRSDKAGSLVSPSSPFSLISMATSHTSPSTRLYDGSSPHIAKGGVPIRTGDAKADADIAAFYAARQKLLRERELGRKAPDS